MLQYVPLLYDQYLPDLLLSLVPSYVGKKRCVVRVLLSTTVYVSWDSLKDSEEERRKLFVKNSHTWSFIDPGPPDSLFVLSWRRESKCLNVLSPDPCK